MIAREMLQRIRRVLQSGTDIDGVESQRLVDLIRSSPDRKALVAVLASDSDSDVRGWTAGVMGEILGVEAVPLLIEMSRRDRVEDNRSLARATIDEIDPRSLNQVVPDMLRDLAAATDTLGDAGQTIWMLAKMKYPGAAAALRAFAARFEPGDYSHEMPMLVAEYLDDPTVIARRMRAHDHEHMFWLAEAAAILQPAGAMDALRFFADGSGDETCGEVCRDAIRVHIERQRTT